MSNQIKENHPIQKESDFKPGENMSTDQWVSINMISVVKMYVLASALAAHHNHSLLLITKERAAGMDYRCLKRSILVTGNYSNLPAQK